MDVSLVLPAYNEAERLSYAVELSIKVLESLTPAFEIIIAEDGSTDGTDVIANQLASNHTCVKHLHFDARQGRGRALNKAFKFSSGNVLCYIDVDLATDMKHLKELIDSIRFEGYDLSTGSRMMPESNAERPLKRDFASKGYNFLVRTVLRSKLYDHQCGFKAFSRETLYDLMDKAEDTHWFWDTEMLVLAQLNGLNIKEFPVVWKHGGNTTVNLKKDIIGMGKQIFRLRWQIWTSENSSKK